MLSTRPYGPDDAAAFVALNREWIEKYFTLEEEDNRIFSNPGLIIEAGGAILMALEEQRVVGTCALVKLDGNRYELAKMAVEPASRGNGVGSFLMSAILAKAKSMDADALILQTNSRLTSALRLYEKSGFRRVQESAPHSTFRRADVTMVRDLRQDQRNGI